MDITSMWPIRLNLNLGNDNACYALLGQYRPTTNKHIDKTSGKEENVDMMRCKCVVSCKGSGGVL